MTHVTRQDQGPLKMLGVTIPNTRPHWLRYGDGSAAVAFRTHEKAEWLDIDTTERSKATNSSKRTMVTLDRAAALALRDLLNEVFSEPSPSPAHPRES